MMGIIIRLLNCLRNLLILLSDGLFLISCFMCVWNCLVSLLLMKILCCVFLLMILYLLVFIR